MKRLVVVAVLLFPLAVRAESACPSVKWTLGQPTVTVDPFSYVRRVAVVDYDEDGELDVVGVVQGSSISKLAWWKGAGDNTFGPLTTIVTDFSFSNIAIADATGDGRDDVIVGRHSADSLLILPATGSGRGPATETYLAMTPRHIVAINRDADPAVELVVSDIYFGRFIVFDNIATSLSQIVEVLTSSISQTIVSADFDGDGRLDVAASLYNENKVAVYHGKANGTFDPPVYFGGVYPMDLTLGDLDGDGRQDLVAGNADPGFPGEEGNVSIYMNEGARSFTHTTFSVDRPGRIGDVGPVLLSDVSGDGVLDLIAGVVNGGWTTTAVGLGDGTFRTPTFQGIPYDDDGIYFQSPQALAVADFTGDGVPDLLTGSSYEAIYPSTASCTTQLDLYTESRIITIGDEVMLHAHVSGFGPDTPAPLGTVTLREGVTVLGTSSVAASGKTSFSLSGLGLGDHLLTAEFSGNAALPAAFSAVVMQQVTSATTQTTITLPASPSVYGQPFPIQITVTGSTSEYVFVTVDLDGVKSQHYTYNPFNSVLEPGSHTISAKYFGSVLKPASESLPVTFNVAKANPTMSKTGSLVVRVGTSHSLTFTVSGAEATGTVQLLEGATVLAGGALVNGSVTFNPTLTRGAHDVRAVYSGDSHNLDVTQNFTLEVLPNQPFIIEARGLSNGVHIAYLLPPNTNPNSLQLYRNTAGSPGWQLVPGWSPVSGMDTSVPLRGVVYEYQLNASLNNGTLMSTLPDSAMLFNDDVLNTGILVKRIHFSELRTAVNLLRAQAGLTPFEFDASYNASSIVRASHLNGLRTALTQARQTLGMSLPTFSGGGIGTLIKASHIQELRELAR